jgi:RNA polymerase sigma-70 factor (ECF subfamily)
VTVGGFLEHRPQLLRYLRARGAADEAEDLLQDLWIRAASADRGHVEDELAYLYRMAHNLMIDRRRAAARRERREVDYQNGFDPDEPPSAERALVARDQLDRLERTLRGLGERTDRVFRRHRVEGVPQRGIAEELGISLSAVEKHLQKAYRAIGELAREQDDRPTRTGGDR